jgi:hypothetical protein
MWLSKKSIVKKAFQGLNVNSNDIGSQVLRFGMWMGVKVWGLKGQTKGLLWLRCIYWLENQFLNFKLIFNKNDFDLFFFVTSKITKRRTCTLFQQELSNDTKSVMRGLMVWEG